jgi:hypothetical protein
MDAFIENVNTTAMMLGYPVLVVVTFIVVWFGTRIFRDLIKIFREIRYDRWTRANDERDQDNFESSWMLELDEVNMDPVYEDKYPTLELPDIQGQLYNYQEDRYERS